jgi:hypothetical protein
MVRYDDKRLQHVNTDFCNVYLLLNQLYLLFVFLSNVTVYFTF